MIENLFRKSYSDYFYQDIDVLLHNRVLVEQVLEITGNPKYTDEQIEVYLDAFDYFIEYPEEFDGATRTEELPDIPNLDLDAMLHDYLYVALSAAVSWRYMRLTDKLFRREMLRKGKSSWNTGYRYVALTIKTPFWLVWCYYNGRRIFPEQKLELKRICKLLL